MPLAKRKEAAYLHSKIHGIKNQDHIYITRTQQMQAIKVKDMQLNKGSWVKRDYWYVI